RVAPAAPSSSERQRSSNGPIALARCSGRAEAEEERRRRWPRSGFSRARTCIEFQPPFQGSGSEKWSFVRLENREQLHLRRPSFLGRRWRWTKTRFAVGAYARTISSRG